jgi:hypothetical protein
MLIGVSIRSFASAVFLCLLSVSIAYGQNADAESECSKSVSSLSKDIIYDDPTYDVSGLDPRLQRLIAGSFRHKWTRSKDKGWQTVYARIVACPLGETCNIYINGDKFIAELVVKRGIFDLEIKIRKLVAKEIKDPHAMQRTAVPIKARPKNAKTTLARMIDVIADAGAVLAERHPDIQTLKITGGQVVNEHLEKVLAGLGFERGKRHQNPIYKKFGIMLQTTGKSANGYALAMSDLPNLNNKMVIYTGVAKLLTAGPGIILKRKPDGYDWVLEIPFKYNSDDSL